MKNYVPTVLKDELVIKSIVSIHYQELNKDYRFEGERHNFWEFLYVDYGEILVCADGKEHRLKQGEVIFHKPNEWHSVTADGVAAPNIGVVSFECMSKLMKRFENKITVLDQRRRELLSLLLAESEQVFDYSLNNPYAKQLERAEQPPVCGEQLIKNYLILFLISLLRSDSGKKNYAPSIKNSTDSEIANEIICYLNSKLGQPLLFKDVIEHMHLSGTSIKNIFQSHVGTGVMKYYNRLKIDAAKKYLREESYNITQISALLGYDSLHYFSRQFKQYVHMSPTEYAKSIKFN